MYECMQIWHGQVLLNAVIQRTVHGESVQLVSDHTRLPVDLNCCYSQEVKVK